MKILAIDPDRRNLISFTAYGNPVAQKRHRSTRRGNFIHNYDPSSHEKEDFLLSVMNNRPHKPIEGPIKLMVRFLMPRPKSHYRTGKNASALKDNAPHYHTGKPDLDNLMKFVKDALNGIFWKDDSQVCLYSDCEKVYAEVPRTDIIIMEI